MLHGPSCKASAGFSPALPALNPFGRRSCAQLLRELAAHAPDQVGLAYQHERWTWQEINKRANQYAHFVVQQRLQRGDVVALLMDNRPDYLFIASGLNRIGVVSALINTHLTGAGLGARHQGREAEGPARRQ